MYEIQTMKPSFPISFHTDKLCGISRPHWHENIEILHLISGSAKMVIDSQTVLWSPGETIIVNTNSIHQFFPKSTEIEYHCLNININFLEQMGINLNDNYIKAKVRDTEISDLFAHIKMLSVKKPSFFEPEMCCDSLKLATLLVRKHPASENSGIASRNSSKFIMVKKSIVFMKKNFSEPITLDDVSAHVGFTKCHFCRVFKEVTGMTAIKMLNFLRCNEAKRLLLTTECSVKESAASCGYSNLSHFTKTYKEIVGCVPSDTKMYFSEDI